MTEHHSTVRAQQASSAPGWESSSPGESSPHAIGISVEKAPSWTWSAIAAALLFAYFTAHFLLPSLATGPQIQLAYQPLLWTGLALFSIYIWHAQLHADLAITPGAAGAALLIAGFQISLGLLAGIVLGFGGSPYAHTALAIAGNLLFVFTFIIGREWARACILVILGRHSTGLALIATTLLLTLTAIPGGRHGTLSSLPGALGFLGGFFLPAFAENLIASSLALLGGPWASVLYVSGLSLFEWLSPILPALDWPAQAFIGTVGPILGLLILQDLVADETSSESNTEEGREASSSASWLLVAVFAVSIFFVQGGIMGIRPTLITGSSMTPTLRTGDIVFTREVNIDDVQVGDMVRFRTANASVIHRVIEKQRVNGTPELITRGDANNVEDPPITADQLQGEVILTIPKLGWVTIGLHQLIGLAR
ncbi:MAG: signal peptidase I [Anaerolineales bacterium]|nr:signal peptidase I [Anaerolineales bacterium]